jgi:lysophospholipase L1-like esterase
MRMSGRQWVGGIALALVSTAVTLTAVEFALRRKSTNRMPAGAASRLIHRGSSDPALIYELAPGSSCEREGVAIAINSAGFRDDEFPQHPPDGLRIVVLGDSVAWGWAVPMESAFPQVLERQLRQLGSEPYAASIVYNLAVDGYSTAQEIRLLETRGLALHPDLVIVSYVLNDPDEADGGLARYFSSRIEVLERVKRPLRDVRDWIVGYPREYHHRIHARNRDQTIEQFRRLGEISRERHVPILVAVTPVFRFDPPGPYPYQDLHDFIGSLCAANGLRFLDLRPSFDGRDRAEYGFDAWHPTVKGHAVIAQVLVDAIRSMRGDAPGAGGNPADRESAAAAGP